jgi:multiple sugar transport system substrate-binding protein
MTIARRIALLFLPLALVLAACGDNDGPAGGEGEDAAAPPVSEGPASGELTVWAMGAEGEKLSVLADAFMEENPDVTVTVTPTAWDVAHDKLVTSVAGDQAPDISQMGTTWMGEFAALGALDPVPENIDPSAFFEGAYQTNVVDDTAYGVPWYVETRLLYYRTDIAEAAGITEPPADWEALKEMARAMKEEGGAENGIALGTGIGSWQQYLPLVWSNGGEVLTEDGEFALDSPEAVEALEYYASFFDEGLTSPQPEGFDITQGFIQGTYPMFFSGPWHMGLIADQGGAEMEGKWAIAPMPAKESATSFVGGSNLVVFAGTDNRDAAWQFVSYLTQPEVQSEWYAEVAALPSVQAAWEEGELASDEQLATFGQQLEDAQAPPPIPTWEEVASAIDDQIERATIGDASPEEAAAAMEERAESIGVG